VPDSVDFVHPEQRSANPYCPEVAADPLPFYRRLRDECPVSLIDGLESGAHIISRYEDVRFALRHPEIFSSDFVAVDIGQDRPLIPLQIDPPEHAHYRRVMDPHLAAKELAPLEADVRVLVNEVIDRFIDRGEVDFHSEFAMPLPCMVFLSLTGLPLAELPRFLTWKDNIIRPDTMDMDEAASIRKLTGAAIYSFFDEAIAERAGGHLDDIISRFMRTEVDGRSMTRDEMLDLCYLFILGGLDTVTATLDCSVAHLAQHPDDRRALVDDPSRIPAAVEELLRTQTPVMQVLRVVKQPHEMHGVQMEPGDHVLVMLGAADTDPDEFGRDADRVDIERESNRHLAFGGGPHRCLGSHLARLELRVALEELHRRVPEYRLADGAALEYSPGIREIKKLPLVFS
jgi:cytochrome P450